MTKWNKRGDWANRLPAVRALAASPEPAEGYRPTWNAILAGRREFAGRILEGPWVGYEILLLVYGKPRFGHEPRSENFSYFADYWLVDEANAGPGDGGQPGLSAMTLERLDTKLARMTVRWYPPGESLARVGLMFGGTGNVTGLNR